MNSIENARIKDQVTIDASPKNTAPFSEEEIKKNPERFTKESLYKMYGDDPWLHNIALNTWEFATRQIEVESYPVDITLPCIEYCNARCIHCSFWRTDKGKAYSPTDIEKFKPVLKYAVNAGFNPAGETLLHPNIEEMLKTLKRLVDPRCYIYLTTNGLLLDRHFDTLLDIPTSCTISLNAATPNSYASIMGIDSDNFSKLLSNVRELVKRRNESNPKLLIILSFVVMYQNIHEAPDFIALADELGVDWIYLRSLCNVYEDHAQWLVANPNHPKLHPANHPDFEKYVEQTRHAIKEARNLKKIDVKFESWTKPMFLKGGENYSPKPLDHVFINTAGNPRSTSGACPNVAIDYNLPGCRYPYSILMDYRFSNIMPICCNMNRLPGYDYIAYEMGDRFHEKMWNRPAIKELRRLHKEGPLPEHCLICTQLDNVRQGKYYNS